MGENSALRKQNATQRAQLEMERAQSESHARRAIASKKMAQSAVNDHASATPLVLVPHARTRTHPQPHVHSFSHTHIATDARSYSHMLLREPASAHASIPKEGYVNIHH
eukprot:6186835-Pleurochrysis_carterae.AAC.2